MPGEAEYTRKVVLGYLLRGSEAHQKWQKDWKKKDRYNSKGGLFIRGSAWYRNSPVTPYPVAMIIDEVARK